MIAFPNAKINIGLNITEKRADGFHNIETVFYPIPLSDILEINISDENDGFDNTGLKIEDGKIENNLCYKAYQILKKDFKLPPINVHLHKIIPFGAGLGGGSSDASFTLILLNNVFKLNIKEVELLRYAEKIGSDCPFFIKNEPAFATEKGNILNKIDFSLKGYFIIVIHPKIHINTAIAYSKIKPKLPAKSLTNLINEPIETWKGKVSNDFEDVIFKLHPEIGNIKNKLYNLGAVYASMSGSGSAVFGIFNEEIKLKNQFKNYYTWSGIL